MWCRGFGFRFGVQVRGSGFGTGNDGAPATIFEPSWTWFPAARRGSIELKGGGRDPPPRTHTDSLEGVENVGKSGVDSGRIRLTGPSAWTLLATGRERARRERESSPARDTGSSSFLVGARAAPRFFSARGILY